MSGDSRFPGCVKFGCFGCLALVALFVGIILLVGAIQVTTDGGEPSQVEMEAAHDLPAPPPTAAAAEDRPEVPEVLPLPEKVDLVGEPAAGVLVLDLRMGEFTIQPGPPGGPIKVEADYDENAFELAESFSQEEEGWRYEVSFHAKGGWLGLLFHGGGEGSRNKMTITIPRGHPIEIVGEIGLGESETDLGGLWVRRVDLRYGTGDHFLEFREPLPEPMEEFVIDSSMGSLELRNLGEASPARIEVDHGMGDLLLDLQGRWRRDADIEVDFNMGSCRLRLPQDVRVEIARADVGMGEKRIAIKRDEKDLPPDAPVLTLDLSGSMGELRVED